MIPAPPHTRRLSPYSRSCTTSRKKLTAFANERDAAATDAELLSEHSCAHGSFRRWSIAQMWTLLAIGAVASIGFGLVAVVLSMWIDFRPLTNKERPRD